MENNNLCIFFPIFQKARENGAEQIIAWIPAVAEMTF
jgi:hypothetical protein